MHTTYLKHLFLFLFILTSSKGMVLGQDEKEINEYAWLPYGVLPKQYKDALAVTPNYITYPINIHTNFNYNSTDPVFDRLLCSGRLIYGNELFDFSFLSAQLRAKDIITEKDQIIALKSNVSAVLAKDNVILITTDVISQSTNWENIIYLILRAKVREELRLPFDKYRYSSTESLDDLVRRHYNLDLTTEQKIDEKAIQLFIEKGYKTSDAMRALDVLRFSDLPFEDYFVPTDYFDGKDLFIPKEFLSYNDLEGASMTENQFGNLTINLDLLKRKEVLGNLYPINSEIYSPAPKSFITIRDHARLQIIEEQLVNNKYEQALYSIFVMQKTKLPGTKNYLDLMKVHAWYGLVRSHYSYDTKRYQLQLTNNNKSESERFFHVLKKLNAYGIAGLGLRYVTDIASENKSIQEEVLQIRQEMIYFLVQSKRFPIDKFSKQPYRHELTAKQNESENKYDKINRSDTSETISINPLEFYFFAIPDLISSSSFMSNFLDSTSKEENKKSTSFSLKTSIYKLSRKGMKIKNSESISNSISGELDYLSNKSGKKIQSAKPKSIENQAHELVEINQLLLQNFMSTRTTTNIFPISYSRLTESLKDIESKQLFTQHVDIYKLKIKGYHYLGLLIIPLPFVVTDILINANQSNYLAFVYDSNTRRISYFENSQLSYPWNTPSSKAQIISTLKKLENE